MMWVFVVCFCFCLYRGLYPNVLKIEKMITGSQARGAFGFTDR